MAFDFENNRHNARHFLSVFIDIAFSFFSSDLVDSTHSAEEINWECSIKNGYQHQPQCFRSILSLQDAAPASEGKSY